MESLKHRDKNRYIVQEMFFNKKALLDQKAKLLKLRAYQYFQKEYVCILNLFKDKRGQFLTLLSWFLNHHRIDFKFIECFQYFIFISSSDIARLSNLVFQFTELIKPNLAHFVYNYQNLKFGQIRFQLLVRFKSKKQEIQIENLLKNFNCVTYTEYKYMIIFFFDYRGFMTSQIELQKNQIEYDFYYSQPRVVRKEVLFQNEQKIEFFQLRQKLDYFYNTKSENINDKICEKNNLVNLVQPIKDLIYYIDFSFISFYKMKVNKEFIELIQNQKSNSTEF
ncbi:hypothetical protein TTHERM_000498079 (macronuclear) [Tetrahymena thermophila SB210]|uniref:Uncharacterized protein n=1 Tax=Tetrahymena thermophila (strain SB210) TaxID=312017 RepID=W7WVX4_TETTS|nr:hypothetical protein TTHERM_000498079 [Tetrahymena thermophila SB210]EWS70965.1 hypothetical protein TTHERM_000498079 [Tetrahymena thermophila SB210]|eukprot:XP_012656521.1 hypothetical protein TTHERM_000498079 [Tetrahymena thermophila SB210]